LGKLILTFSPVDNNILLLTGMVKKKQDVISQPPLSFRSGRALGISANLFFELKVGTNSSVPLVIPKHLFLFLLPGNPQTFLKRELKIAQQPDLVV
jgi:hypothetical protein